MKYLERSRFSFWSISACFFVYRYFSPFPVTPDSFFFLVMTVSGKRLLLYSLLFSLYESLFSDLAFFTAANYFFVARKWCCVLFTADDDESSSPLG